MEIILKHLNGVEQYLFLQNMLQGVFEDPIRQAQTIQAIMNDVNQN